MTLPCYANRQPIDHDALLPFTPELMPSVELAVHSLMQLGEMAMKFAEIERVPRYTPIRRENDAEHSFMLALTAAEISASYFPSLDPGLVSQFSIVHDLVELETGDIATFDIDDAALANKHKAEQAASAKMQRSLPIHTGSLLQRYELQMEPEARFVRFIDKLLPLVVDIAGPGEQVMREDYGVHTTSQLEVSENKMNARFQQMFPEPGLAFVHAIRDVLARRFAGQFEVALQT